MKATTLNHPIMPNFLVAGAAKCGTTSLYHYLKQHPNVFMSDVKEPNFLIEGAPVKSIGVRDRLSASRDIRSYEAYLRLFEKAYGYQAVGEASISTLFLYPYSIPAIKRYLGDPRIIIILRDPAERAYSAYTFLVRDGWEPLSFAESLQREEKRAAEGYRLMWRYRALGLYSHQVRAFQEQFSSVLVLLYDDLKRDPSLLMRSVYAFLGVDDSVVPQAFQIQNPSGNPRSRLLNALLVKPKRLHAVARRLGGAVMGERRWIELRESLRRANLRKPPPPEPQIMRELREDFREDILKLQELIGRDLSAWIKGPRRSESIG